MLGAIAGDIIGSPYEFAPDNIKSTVFPLFSEKSKFTDDTVMTVAIAEGIMSGYGNPESTATAVVKAMRKYGRMFPAAGYGQNFYRWLMSENPIPYNSYGNGSAMRVSPVAWAYDTLEEVALYARISATTTHDHPEGIKGACATAAAVFMARKGFTKEQIKRHIRDRYGYNLNRALDEIRPTYVHVESCQRSVPEAITAFLESGNFEDALRKAVSLGGDSDTLAAISGSIAEGFYGGIPLEILNEVMSILDERLVKVIRKWQNWLHGGRKAPLCTSRSKRLCI